MNKHYLSESLKFSTSVRTLTALMKEELDAIDTESLKARLNELRRYL